VPVFASFPPLLDDGEELADLELVALDEADTLPRGDLVGLCDADALLVGLDDADMLLLGEPVGLCARP
jgi:hypothetical protein